MNREIAHIPTPEHKRVVIAGAGFAGLKLARKLAGTKYQVVLIDKNNFHHFQPLLYQVAMAGLEPNAIAFPVRKVLQEKSNMHFRMAELTEINIKEKWIATNLGRLGYDYLVIAIGTVTNYFGIESAKENSLAMKTLSDAIYLRNTILSNFEKALNVTEREELDSIMNIIVTGGGPTGVELAGALAEMKNYILPKDYPELNFNLMNIYLFEGLDRLLTGMSENASARAEKYLEKLGVKVKTGVFVEDFTDHKVKLSNGEVYPGHTVIWAAGVKSEKIQGLPSEVYEKGGRVKVNSFNQVDGVEDIFVIGDYAMMKAEGYPEGHPQLAQPAIQQAEKLAQNLKRDLSGKKWKEFVYKDKGTLATVGRHLAVADLPWIRLRGFTAWALWSVVHLASIIGARNKLVIFLNWIWNYFNYRQAHGLLIKPKTRNGKS